MAAVAGADSIVAGLCMCRHLVMITGSNMEVPPLCCQGYAWAEDKEHCEEYGRMLSADPRKVSARAKKRGLPQVHSPCSSELP